MKKYFSFEIKINVASVIFSIAIFVTALANAYLIITQ